MTCYDLFNAVACANLHSAFNDCLTADQSVLRQVMGEARWRESGWELFVVSALVANVSALAGRVMEEGAERRLWVLRPAGVLSLVRLCDVTVS